MSARPLALLVALAALATGSGASLATLEPQELWSTAVPREWLAATDPDAPAPARAVLPASFGEGAAEPVFGGEVRVSSTDRIGEPALKIDGNGVVYVHAPGRLFRSTDGGASFAKVPVTGQPFGMSPVTCGCDSDVAIDDLNNVFYTDLAYPNCVNVGVSADKGDHWVTNRRACGLDEGTGMDRQWIETDGKAHSYLTYRTGGTILLAFGPLGPVPAYVNVGPVNSQSSNFRAGYLAVDKATDTAYLSYTSGQSVRVVVVKAGAPVADVLVAPTGGSNLDAFSAPAVDRAGNVYMVWNERATVGGAAITKTMFSSSTDGAMTWRTPVRVDTTATSVFPWIVGGADGRVGVVYYGSADARLPGAVQGDWFVHYAFSANAHDAAPTFVDVEALGHKVRTGPICTQGTGCAGGTRGFLDFFGVHLFPDGRAGIAFNDQESLVPTERPYVHFVQQVDGPRLL